MNQSLIPAKTGRLCVCYCVCPDFDSLQIPTMPAIWAAAAAAAAAAFCARRRFFVNRRHRIHARLSCAFACRRPLGDHGNEHHDGAVVRRWVTAPRVCGAGGLVLLSSSASRYPMILRHRPHPRRVFFNVSPFRCDHGMSLYAHTVLFDSAPHRLLPPCHIRRASMMFVLPMVKSGGIGGGTVIGMRVGGHACLACSRRPPQVAAAGDRRRRLHCRRRCRDGA